MTQGGNEDDDPWEGLATSSELKWDPWVERDGGQFNKRVDESERPDLRRPPAPRRDDQDNS